MTKHYLSYLLRLWQVDMQQKQAWLASVEDPHTRQVVSFNTLEELFEFIMAQTISCIEEPSFDSSCLSGYTSKEIK